MHVYAYCFGNIIHERESALEKRHLDFNTKIKSPAYSYLNLYGDYGGVTLAFRPRGHRGWQAKEE